MVNFLAILICTLKLSLAAILAQLLSLLFFLIIRTGLDEEQFYCLVQGLKTVFSFLMRPIFFVKTLI